MRARACVRAGGRVWCGWCVCLFVGGGGGVFMIVRVRRCWSREGAFHVGRKNAKVESQNPKSADWQGTQ